MKIRLSTTWLREVLYLRNKQQEDGKGRFGQDASLTEA